MGGSFAPPQPSPGFWPGGIGYKRIQDFGNEDYLNNEGIKNEEKSYTGNSGTPYYRLTGVQITVMADYTNKERDGRNDNLDGKYIKCNLKVVSAKGKWSALGPDVGGAGGAIYGTDFPYDFVDSYKYGVTFQVIVTGELGEFDL